MCGPGVICAFSFFLYSYSLLGACLFVSSYRLSSTSLFLPSPFRFLILTSHCRLAPPPFCICLPLSIGRVCCFLHKQHFQFPVFSSHSSTRTIPQKSGCGEQWMMRMSDTVSTIVPDSPDRGHSSESPVHPFFVPVTQILYRRGPLTQRETRHGSKLNETILFERESRALFSSIFFQPAPVLLQF